MQSYQSVIFILLLWVFELTASPAVRYIGGKDHHKGLTYIERDIEHTPYDYLPIHKIQIEVFKDTFKFVNLGKTTLLMESIETSEKGNYYFNGKRVEPGDTGKIFYCKVYNVFEQGLKLINDTIRVKTSSGFLPLVTLDYQILFNINLKAKDIESGKKLFIYKIPGSYNRESRIYLDTQMQLLEFGLYNSAMNKRIGEWKRYKNKCWSGDTMYQKCLSLQINRNPWETCSEFDLIISTHSDQFSPLALINQSYAEVLIEPWYDSLIVRSGDSIAVFKIEFNRLADWNLLPVCLEISDHNIRTELLKTMRNAANYDSDEYLMVMEEPYANIYDINQAESRYGFKALEINGRYVRFRKAYLGLVFMNTLKDDWKVAYVCKSVDTMKYLNNIFVLYNVREDEIKSLDSLMYTYGFMVCEMPFSMQRGYRFSQKILGKSYLELCNKLMFAYPEQRFSAFLVNMK